jgi:hypothetical protein
MTQANDKNISDRAKRAQFDIEEDFQDKNKVNAKPSEPASTNKNQTSTREVKKGGSVPAKKI